MTDKNSKEKISRIDSSPELHNKILPLCRLRKGEIWEDKINGHKVGVLDATDSSEIDRIFLSDKSQLIINDPPYNLAVGNNNTSALSKVSLEDYLDFSRKWVNNSIRIMDEDASFYVWLGADQKDGFQPLADFMILMREFDQLRTRSFITMRNQRGYGTQKNWMSVRQELLYYVKGDPFFNVQYTDIPKILKGYYKNVKGETKDNIERSKSAFIRPGNVWVDIQQVFYRIKENVSGAYAQKPLKAIERIISSSSRAGELVTDFFSHSGSTLIASEKLNRRCFTFDINPVFAELSIRRLEHYRDSGDEGWQWNNPFPELE